MRLHTLAPTQGDSATGIRNPVGDRQQTALLRTVILLFIKILRRDGQTQLISFPVFRFDSEERSQYKIFYYWSYIFLYKIRLQCPFYPSAAS
jgi:hypothetical protein